MVPTIVATSFVQIYLEMSALLLYTILWSDVRLGSTMPFLEIIFLYHQLRIKKKTLIEIFIHVNVS
jgi:hypothetical protein